MAGDLDHPILELRGISKYFGNVTALEDISTKVHPGKVTCVLGDNGAGKSTFIKILSGVHQPSGGDFLMDGHNVHFNSPREARTAGIATVFQDLAMAPLMSVWRNFFLGSEPTKGIGPFKWFDSAFAKRTAKEEMAKMGIDVRDIDQPVGTLSGGERQSVAIARAVYFGARVLILDEPTSALGVKQAGVVLKYTRMAADRGLGVIFITHNPNHAFPVGDRFLLLNRGTSLGDFGKEEISRQELTRLMAGGAELEAIEHEIGDTLTLSIADASPLEVVTIGRVSVDLYAQEANVGFAGQQTFEKSIGGSPTNVAVAAARYGHRAAVITKVGADPFGDYVRNRLVGFGVDTRFVGTHPTLRTPLAFAAMDPPEDPPLLFYREPNAPDMTVELSEVDLDCVRDAPVFWISASALSKDPVAATTSALLAHRGRRPLTVLDLDYRPQFWPDEATAHRAISAAVDQCTVAIGNRKECEVAVGSSDPREAIRRLLDRGVELAIVKQGADGVLVATPTLEPTVVRPYPVQVVCGLGAGDAFGGAVCHGLLAGWDPIRIVEFANVAGAIVASRLLCSDAMPFEPEVSAVLEEQRRAH